MSEKTYKLQDLIDKYPDEMAKVMVCPKILDKFCPADRTFNTVGSLLLAAFIWRNSPQGFAYWKEIHDAICLEERGL